MGRAANELGCHPRALLVRQLLRIACNIPHFLYLCYLNNIKNSFIIIFFKFIYKNTFMLQIPILEIEAFMNTLKFHQATIYISELHQFLIYFCFRNGFFVHLIFHGSGPTKGNLLPWKISVNEAGGWKTQFQSGSAQYCELPQRKNGEKRKCG